MHAPTRSPERKARSKEQPNVILVESEFALTTTNLVDSASSHMLVSRTKPCMPQNHCIAGICAWLITSDVICRKNCAVSASLDTLAKRQANT